MASSFLRCGSGTFVLLLQSLQATEIASNSGEGEHKREGWMEHRLVERSNWTLVKAPGKDVDDANHLDTLHLSLLLGLDVDGDS
jgi:hypothetical protein